MFQQVIRGKINFRDRSTQVRDYSGIRYKNITPTDIDGFFEIGNKVFVFIELKNNNESPFEYGQKLALERLCDVNPKPTLLVVAVHNTPNKKDIDAANCLVSEYRYMKKWHKGQKTVKELIDRFLIHNGLGDYV